LYTTNKTCIKNAFDVKLDTHDICQDQSLHMEQWEKLVKIKGPITAGEINDNLATVYSYIGAINVTDVDRLRLNELPVSFVALYNNHWIAIYLDKNRLEIMDSTHSLFEAPPPAFINFLYQNRDTNIRFNPVLQTNETNVCGLYCIHFIQEKAKHVSYSNILKTFTNNSVLNDYIIISMQK